MWFVLLSFLVGVACGCQLAKMWLIRSSVTIDRRSTYGAKNVADEPPCASPRRRSWPRAENVADAPRCSSSWQVVGESSPSRTSPYRRIPVWRKRTVDPAPTVQIFHKRKSCCDMTNPVEFSIEDRQVQSLNYHGQTVQCKPLRCPE